MGVASVDVLGETFYTKEAQRVPSEDTEDGWTVVEVDVEHKFKALPQIASGDGFTVALQIDGTVLTWGRNDKVQLGNNTDT